MFLCNNLIFHSVNLPLSAVCISVVSKPDGKSRGFLLHISKILHIYSSLSNDKKTRNCKIIFCTSSCVHMISCNINCGILCLVNEFRNYHHRIPDPVPESWIENPVQGYKGLNSHGPKVRDSIYSYTLNFLLDSQIC